jgi:hypothetical protein
MADEGANARSALELRKLELEVEKLRLDVANATRVSRFEPALRLLPTITILVTVLGFAFSVWQYRAEQGRNRLAAEQQAAREASERADRTRKEEQISQREFMKPLLEKQQQLYFDAASVAATIASSPDPAERRKAEGRFWTLYYGPLVMVEGRDVSGAMKAFGRCVTGEDKCGTDEIKQRSLKLASTLETSMLKTWNAKPEEFIQGQFVYR